MIQYIDLFKISGNAQNTIDFGSPYILAPAMGRNEKENKWKHIGSPGCPGVGTQRIFLSEGNRCLAVERLVHKFTKN
jgi:hypothetical protein